jgi:hypothetical protein
VTQRRVLEAALQLGLTVQLSAPALREADTWQEAFLTNWWVGWSMVVCTAVTPCDCQSCCHFMQLQLDRAMPPNHDHAMSCELESRHLKHAPHAVLVAPAA